MSSPVTPALGNPSKPEVVDALIAPEGSLEVLSQHEVVRLRDTSLGGLHELLRRCTLAVLNSGSVVDDSLQVMQRYRISISRSCSRNGASSSSCAMRRRRPSSTGR